MRIEHALKNIERIKYMKGSPQVVPTAASELSKHSQAEIDEVPTLGGIKTRAGAFSIAIATPSTMTKLQKRKLKNLQEPFIYFQIREDGSGWIVASEPYHLFGFVCHLLDYLSDQNVQKFYDGKVFTPAFNWQRISYDFFLTQEGRIQRNFNRETYIRELARLGFTHVEVNGLAFPMSLETGPKGETYPMFYTYCPALDQFVFSRLNKGLYPYYYLSANLNYLKSNAKLAVKYGLTPGLLCFEPRSVPEKFFEKYPMLRGARVDHPFRSFKPRYNMTITHPRVREHYTEMIKKLLVEVPELGFICVWTNDSGAGFEHTKSLYVGRNGGAYLIREWKDDEEIASLAGENALRFFRVLRDAGQEVNPEFRVITRMESFYGEHDTIWDGLGNRVDLETASLIARGWDMPYTHPRYSDSKSINPGTVYQSQFSEEEKSRIVQLASKDCSPHFYFAAGPNAMFAPLLGIPYPFLSHRKLKTFHQNGVKFLAHNGGTHPPELVPYNVNHEIVRQFQFNPELDIQEEVEKIARKWASTEFYQDLVKAWKLTEDAILAFPIVTPLYATFGFTWYRLWVRPFVPNVEALPQHQRDYYEDFMCTTPHNPNNVDLSRDVLFQLTTPEKSRLDVQRIDQNLWPPLNKAIKTLRTIQKDATQKLGERTIIHDQLIRLQALRCWFMTQRSVAAWITGVYGYMNAGKTIEKDKNRKIIKETIEKEIRNSTQLQELLETGIEFMATTDLGETPLIHGSNLKNLLQKRIEIMQEHIDDEPLVDQNYTERRAAELIP